MKSISISTKPLITSILFDFIAVVFIFLVPSISHLVGIPLYILDPMRCALFFAILFTNKKNTYTIALLLPMVSFLISSHPYFYKVFLISSELVINVWLFYLFAEKFKNVFLTTLASIIISKAIYYLFKFILMGFLSINDSLVSTSITIQLFVALALSIIMTTFFRKQIAQADKE